MKNQGCILQMLNSRHPHGFIPIPQKPGARYPPWSNGRITSLVTDRQRLRGVTPLGLIKGGDRKNRIAGYLMALDMNASYAR
jgi:hypothetical protein